MLCERCGVRPATISFTQVINGVKSEAHLCSECAAELGDFGIGSGLDFSFQNFLTGMLNQGGWLNPFPATGDFTCPTCGLTYERFRETGRLGCADCYQAFHDQLIPLLRRIQSGTQHQGKVPGKAQKETEAGSKLEQLQAELKKAVEEENYERAAELRDAIQELKAKKEGHQ
ncbi:MAG: UvrB/UvrC motif-containing protein [Firmicutes bacterium]|nr:UvrB/UvrC motif-containing protein [Bacillota bacterium]